MNRDDASKFQVGDRVYAPYRGYGTVTAIHSGTAYPIEVTWDECKCADLAVSTFTKDGCLSQYFDNDDTILTVVEKTPLKGEKEMEEDSKFKVGYRVFYPYHGLGTVIANHNDGRLYPIDVKWDKSPKGCEVTTFTKDGFLVASLGDCGDNDKLTVVEKVMPAEEEKKPRVSSKEEAYDIMTHLMNREQLEGFLWGNIIKYAYRYGRKGDEAETAGKIKWYAQKLKELGERESE